MDDCCCNIKGKGGGLIKKLKLKPTRVSKIVVAPDFRTETEGKLNITKPSLT